MASKRQDGVPVPPVVGVNQEAPIRYGWKKNHKKAVLPVFGKRSVDGHQDVDSVADNDYDDEQQLQRLIEEEEDAEYGHHAARHHRQTRHDLYSKIEVYLNS